MKIFNKKNLIKLIISILILLNFYQFIIIRTYTEAIKSNDTEFKYTLTAISNGIIGLEENLHDEVSSVASLSSATGKSVTIYPLTSYYSENELLYTTIFTLNNNITNRTNIHEVLAANDLRILIPALKKVEENPLDVKATEELHYLVRKHTEIGANFP